MVNDDIFTLIKFCTDKNSIKYVILHRMWRCFNILDHQKYVSALFSIPQRCCFVKDFVLPISLGYVRVAIPSLVPRVLLGRNLP